MNYMAAFNNTSFC